MSNKTSLESINTISLNTSSATSGDGMYEQLINNQSVRNTLSNIVNNGIAINFNSYGIDSLNNPGFDSINLEEIVSAIKAADFVQKVFEPLTGNGKMVTQEANNDNGTERHVWSYGVIVEK